MSEIIFSNLITSKRELLKLSAKEIKDIKRALKVLESDLEMEVLYDHIVDAFWDYRNKVDYWRLRSLGGFHTQSLGYEVKSSLNRLAFNVFNLSKLFLDKHYHEKNNQCFVFKQTGDHDLQEKVRIDREKITENNDRYYIGCKLRNRNQHGKLPVSQFSSGFKLRKVDERRFITFKITLSYEELKKLDVPEARMPPNNTIDLTDVLDGYLHAISEMHLFNRLLTKDIVSLSKQTLQNTISQVVSQENQDSYIIDLHSSDQPTEYIGLDRFYLSDHLRKKHPYAIDYSKFSFDLSGY